jgi:hypothetical protein
MCAPRVTQHISIRYSSSCHTRFKMGASIFLTVVTVYRLFLTFALFWDVKERRVCIPY